MAAARLLQRRLVSLLCRGRLQPLVSQGLAWSSHAIKGIRDIQIEAGLTDTASEDAGDLKPCQDDPKRVSDLDERLGPIAKESSVSYTAFANLKASKRHDLAVIFTCKVCETRSMKTLCRESYEKGVVVVRCGGCNNLHLMADRLGWFGEPGSVEDLLAARGEEVRKGSVDTLNLTLEDLAGSKSS
ncbi:DNL-type zinc finger protein [Cocos nucifera]|uniref:DNL-type zinc finger protein n=1 Tax=Cocos nucifera TaxID=13894 RepID=A0A8K0IIG1_COCNU|nr:DNL-type zinc finger protein [Cocos nucifera]